MKFIVFAFILLFLSACNQGAEIQTENQNLREEIATLESTVTELEKNMEQSKSDTQHHQEIVKSLKADLSQLQSELAAMTEQNKILKQKNKELNNLLDEVTQLPDISTGDVPPAPRGSMIESKIDGTFEGWDGETIFNLTNGQVWQQASYDYYYHYDYRPSVQIVKDGTKYIMHVEGTSKSVQVTRLK